MFYNEIIMELSQKNKYYRRKNEPLIQVMRNYANYLEEEETKQGIKQEEVRTQSQKMFERSTNILNCGTFIKLSSIEGKAKITSGNFCHDKFCCLCQKIRSVKRYAQMLNVLNILREIGYIYGDNGYIVGMITLTQTNVPVEELDAEIERLSKGIKRLIQSKLWKESIKGYAKSLEITYNSKTRTFHPHYHFLVIWDKKNYNHQHATIQSMWKKALRVQYEPRCDIREAYGRNANLSSIITECLKYNLKSAKENDVPLYADLSVREFALLIKALKNKRLVSYNGIIADIRRQLHYQNEDIDKATEVILQKDIILPEQVNTIVLQWSETEERYKEFIPDIT